MGLLFIGMSVGPLLTGYIMRTTGLLLPVFYATAAIDTTVSLGVWFIMPESLSEEDMQKRRESRAQQLQAMSPLKRWGSTFDIVSPLGVLLPRRSEGVESKHSFDWTMTILGAAYGFGTMVQAGPPLAICSSADTDDPLGSVVPTNPIRKFCIPLVVCDCEWPTFLPLVLRF